MTDFRCQINGTLGGSLPWSNALHITGSISEGALSAGFSTLVDALWTDEDNGLEKFMNADVVVTGTLTTTLNATMHQTTGTETTLDIPGTDANASLPWNIAEVVTLRSPQRTKWGHGRMFLPPFAEDQIVAHVIKAATITSMVTVFETFFAGITELGAAPFIFNQRTRKDGTAPYTKTTLTSFDVSNKPAQQRRRVSKIVPARSAGTF